MRSLIIASCSTLLLLSASLDNGAAPLVSASSLRSAPTTPSKSRLRDLKMLSAKLPLSFELNEGQFGGSARYITRGSGSTLLLATDESILVLQKPAAAPVVTDGTGESSQSADTPSLTESLLPRKTAVKSGQPLSTTLRMKLVGANASPDMVGENRLPGKISYFIGNDPKQWRRNIPTYARVRYRSIYPGIDLVYYGNQQRLEHDFIISPKADPKTVTLSFSGAKKVELTSTGDLLLQTAVGEVRQTKPIAYQETDHGRQEVAAAYVLKGDSQVSFELGSYDLAKPLIIDPILWYSTYFGGSGDDWINDVAVDGTGSTYVTGRTASPDLLATGSYGSVPGSSSPVNVDAFVMKLGPTSSSDASPALIYSVIFGGGAPDEGNAIAVDSAGNVYVTGFTNSLNFPFQNAFDSTQNGGADAFLVKFRADSNAILYSTYFGGSSADVGNAIAVDANGFVYITGDTASSDLPKKNSLQSFGGGISDAFVAKFNPVLNSSSSLIYSTLLGGSGDDNGSGIAVDANGNAYVTGKTGSTNFPLKNQFQGDKLGTDAFVTKLTGASVPSIAYSTYLGGNNNDSAQAIALDSKGNAYVTGSTLSTDFPTKTTALFTSPFQNRNNGGQDAFVAKLGTLNAGAASLIYSAYLGGSGDDAGRDIAVDGNGNAYIAGFTASKDFRTVNPLAPVGSFDGSHFNGGLLDAFVAEVNSLGSALPFSTYLGGVNEEQAYGIALDSKNNIYVAGLTEHDFPIIHPWVFGPFNGGTLLGTLDLEGFVAKIGPIPSGAGVTGSWDSLRQVCHGAGANHVCLLKGRFIVTNVGKATAGNFVVRFYLSDDSIIDETDLLLKEVHVGELQSQESKQRQIEVRLPRGTSASGLVVIAFVDANNDVDEPNENNNIIVSSPIP